MISFFAKISSLICPFILVQVVRQGSNFFLIHYEKLLVNLEQ